MKKLLFIMLLACNTLLSGNALAAKVKCEPAKFERLMQKEDEVFVRLVGLPWHKLGTEGDNDLEKKINRLRKADRKGWHVQLVFPKGYEDENCQIKDPTYTIKRVKLMKSYNGEEMDAEEGTE